LKKFVLTAVSSLALLGSVFPQTGPASVPPTTEPLSDRSVSRADEAEERIQLAISSLDYPVTPGDIYQLSYRESAGAIVTRQFQVDGISILDLGVFGKIYALNMPFYELKQNVENLISRNYTYSTPSLSIVSPGVFRVAVRVESSRLQYIAAWGLSRISEIVASVDTPGTSIRNVERISREGKSEMFDLLKDTSTSLDGADPLVHPGDTIVLRRAERSVDLLGEVRRPGRYELLETEGLQDLIDVFGEGFTRKADLERLQIVRATESGERVEYYPYRQAHESPIALNDGDKVVIGDKTAIRSLVWFEGAVSAVPGGGAAAAAPPDDPAEAAPQSSGNGRFFQPISDGVRLSDVLQEVRASILPTADLGAALLTIPGKAEAIVVDLQPLLSRSDLSADRVLAPNTRIFIPAYRSLISVAGAVIVPGFVPYLPGAPAQYYIGLCGGFDPERNGLGALSVYDQFGRRRRKGQAIMPGDSIYAKNNDLGYRLERSAPVYATILSAAATVVTLGVMSGLIEIEP